MSGDNYGKYILPSTFSKWSYMQETADRALDILFHFQITKKLFFLADSNKKKISSNKSGKIQRFLKFFIQTFPFNTKRFIDITMRRNTHKNIESNYERSRSV